MIIDAHAHIFPDKIASRAADGISSFYDIPVRFDGSVGQLLEINRKAGVDQGDSAVGGRLYPSRSATSTISSRSRYAFTRSSSSDSERSTQISPTSPAR